MQSLLGLYSGQKNSSMIGSRAESWKITWSKNELIHEMQSALLLLPPRCVLSKQKHFGYYLQSEVSLVDLHRLHLLSYYNHWQKINIVVCNNVTLNNQLFSVMHNLLVQYSFTSRFSKILTLLQNCQTWFLFKLLSNIYYNLIFFKYRLQLMPVLSLISIALMQIQTHLISVTMASIFGT